MNYIKQLNTFYRLLPNNSLSSNAQCLYMFLLNKNNELCWIKEFTVANTIVCGFTGLNISALQRARNQLVQKGYIKYQKGISNKAGIYSIIEFEQQNEQQDEQQSEQQGEQQTDNTTNNKPHILNKLNKTKLNKTKYKLNEFNLYNNFDENLKCDCISKSTKQKCERRSSYNINGINYCNQHSKPIITKYLSKKNVFIPPSLEDVKNYVLEKKLNVDAEYFYNYFTDGNWIDSKGNPVRNWKQKLITWDKYSHKDSSIETKKENNEPNEQDKFVEVDTSQLTEEEYGKLMRKEITLEELIKKGRINVG